MNIYELSIIMPVYNVAHYLDRSIRSILVQSFQNFELIAVDDGSSDGSSDILDNYAREDERIVVLHEPNRGVSAARNTALQLFKGKYLTFVDPDDFIAPNTYLENMEYLNSHSDVDILQYPYCHYIDDAHKVQ